MKRRVLTFVLALVMILGMVPAGLVSADEAAASAVQIGDYLAADLTDGTLTGAAVEGDTENAYEDGAVTVNKTIAGTDKENEFDITLNVVTKDKIEEISVGEDAAAVLVIDSSLSMAEEGRLEAAKAAAQAFIDSFVSEDETVTRKVAIVSFSGCNEDLAATLETVVRDGATTVQGWTDASALTGSCDAIAALTADGGTNMEAGVLLARNLLASGEVADIANKNIILLSDGNPTYSVHSDGYTSSAEVICPDGTNMTGRSYVTSCSDHNGVEELMDAMPADIATYAVYVGNQAIECVSCGMEMAGADWLASAGFTTYAAEDASELKTIFVAITHLIEMKARAWQLTDPMGEFVEFVEFVGAVGTSAVDAYAYDAETNAIHWNLRKTAPVVDEANGTYTYALSYRIVLNNLAEDFEPETYYAANGTTAVTYMVTTTDNDSVLGYKEGVAYFNIPSVKGLAADLTVTKVGSFDEPLADVAFELACDGYTVNGTTDENGEISFTGIPSGHEYTLTETAPEGYTGTEPLTVTVAFGTLLVNGQSGDVTVQNTSELTDVTVTKIWEDESNKDGKRPESITLHLWDGETEVASMEVTGDEDTWTAVFEALPKYRGGEEIVYTVTEDAVAEYTTTVDGLTVTNTYTTDPIVPAETVNKTVTKVWEDDNNKAGVRPESIEVVLYANGEKVDTLTLNAENNWTCTVENLPKLADGKEIEYTVEETTKLADYTVSYDQATLTVTNTIVRQVPTGDTFQLGLFGGMAAVSFAGIVALLFFRKKILG